MITHLLDINAKTQMFVTQCSIVQPGPYLHLNVLRVTETVKSGLYRV